MNDLAVRTLKEAKKVLRERGWYQGGIERNPGGPCCLIGAIQAAAFFGYEPYDTAYKTLIEVTGAEANKLGVWNDAPERSIEEVNDALDEAIEKLSS